MKMRQLNLGSWTKLFDREAKRCGWSLFDCDGTIRILKIDEPDLGEPGDEKLRSDNAAIARAFESAARGERCGLFALFLDGQQTYHEDRNTVEKGLKYQNYLVPGA